MVRRAKLCRFEISISPPVTRALRARIAVRSSSSSSSLASNGILFLRSAEFTASLRLTEVRIPNHTVRNSTARLECHYDMDGEDLYSVKWYKDGHEFYRYLPSNSPPALVFHMPGVSVDVSETFPILFCILFDFAIHVIHGAKQRHFSRFPFKSCETCWRWRNCCEIYVSLFARIPYVALFDGKW